MQRAKRQRKTKPKTPKQRSLALGLLVELQDELADLAAILACVPELQRFAGVMSEVLDGKAWIGADRIGRLALEFTGKPLAEDRRFDAAEQVDVGNAPDAIVAAVRLRLIRLGMFLALVGKKPAA